MAERDRANVSRAGEWVFHDRGLVDAACALEHATGVPAEQTMQRYNRYFDRVFLAPPWPEIYRTDDERQQPLAEAVAEYRRLLETYTQLGYDICILPKVSVVERAEFVLSELGLASSR